MVLNAAPTRLLLSPAEQYRAEVLGHALRLAYTLSAGTPDLLAGTKLVVGRTLTLRLREGSGVFEGESITRRLERLAEVMRLRAETELATA